MIIDESAARRVLAAVDAGLVQGIGKPVPGKMCAAAAVCYALGMPHGDAPPCVSAAVRRLMIRINDAYWSSPSARARGLRRLAVASLGSAGALDEVEFVHRVARLAIQWCVPVALRAAARGHVGAQWERMMQAAELCEQAPTREHALEARDAAYAAAAVAYVDAVRAADYYAAAAADNAAFAAAADYAPAAVAYADAAADAFYVAHGNALYAAVARDADAHLGEFAERVVHVLRDLGSPGSAFLYLTE